MNPDVHYSIWMRLGTSLTWDAEAVKPFCCPEAVRRPPANPLPLKIPFPFSNST